MNIDYSYIFNLPPFSLDKDEKHKLYEEILYELQKHHSGNCFQYNKLCSLLGNNPALPVRLFKEYDLKSISKDEIYKVMTSSGTTGQTVSKIYLDRETSARQAKALNKIVSDFTGKTRLPMLIIDSNKVLKDRNMFSARGAGILGFSMLGRDMTYALDENMNLNLTVIDEFCQKYEGQAVLMFGFTFMVWEHFYKPLSKMGHRLDLAGTLIHGGGWKKLASEAVNPEEFINGLKMVTNADKVLNYYGMVEQTGSIFMECEYGHLHASVFSDIDILRAEDFTAADVGEKGIIKVTSLLPTSYPEHILLSEDEGILEGVDDCPCGRKGKYFKVCGRMQGAEIRGCSDTYERR